MSMTPADISLSLPMNSLFLDEHSQQLQQLFSDPFKPSNTFSMVPQTQWPNNNTGVNQVCPIFGIDLFQYAYIQYIQQIQTLHDTIIRLQVKKAALEGERSTIQLGSFQSIQSN